MIPVYGFLQGDTLGILVFTYESDSVRELSERLQQAAVARVAPKLNTTVLHKGKALNPNLTVGQVGIQALDRIDVVSS